MASPSSSTSSSVRPTPPPSLPQKPNEHRFEDSPLWKLKVRLQFTGWLQYIPNAVAVLVLLAIAGAAAAIGVRPELTVGIPLALAAIAGLVLVYDLATSRYGIHPPETIPAPLTGLDAFDLMRARVSCRSFQQRDLSEAHRARLVQLATEAARPERQIGDAPIRFEHVAAPLTVWPVIGAHEFFVAIAPRTYDRQAIVDVGRSLQKVVLEATRMGVATCWIGPGANQASVAAHLGERFDPERDHIICVCALGYRSRYKPMMLRAMQRSQRWREPLSKLFFADCGLETPLDTAAPPFARFGRTFEACQWSPSSYNGQTTRAVGLTESGPHGERVARVDFGAATRSRFYAPVAVGIWLANWETGCEALGFDGRFVRLSDDARDCPWPEGTVYDVSWVPA